MQLNRIATGLILSISMAAGCYGGADANDLNDTGATAEEAQTSRAWETLAGSWVGDMGPYKGLILTRTPEGRGHHWFADVDSGVRCVRAPCPQATARVEGVYTATSRTLTLTASDSRLTFPTPVLGTFNYTLRGETLRMTRGGAATASLHKAVSYCAEADDCHEQSLITPRCLGRFTCTTENTCRFVCGLPISNEGEFCGGIANIQCAAGLRCVLGGSNPDAGGVCRSSAPSCATVRCASGTHCELRPVTCVRAPCPPQPQCVTTITCASTTCAPGNLCVDTPTGARCELRPPVRCGTTTCAAGMVCCNPLRNICTLPGRVCIQ
jgi:hypothetical protein